MKDATVQCIRDDGTKFVGKVVNFAKGSVCEVTHSCAICGRSALYSGHQTRGGTWKYEDCRSDCPDNFKVRCAACEHEKRKPEPPLILAIELEWNFEGEAMAEVLKRRNADPNIVYDVM